MFSMPAPLGVQFAPGTMLGRYELLATIGTGGMASVILARQRGPAGFEKVVVIKVVHPHMAQDPAAVNMLLDEARVAAQIDHPNVVHTYELGEAYGTFYIVMEYLAGESLAQILKLARSTQQPLSPFLAGKIVADAADGLHFAHELRDFSGNHLGIVHRDVSPGNIVVQYNGTVKVVDFGIAKAEGRVTSTQEGELKGKYGYMPPEQIKNEEMDRRSDVFSLGVVLWEALAQRRLFNANNVAATLMQVLTADRVPPSHYFPSVPHALDITCLRALAPDPDDRFQTVAELKQAIDDAIWQARVGPKEIEGYMQTLFGDRMQTRNNLMRRATVEMLSVGDLESLGLAAFREPVSEHQRSHSGEIHAVDPTRAGRPSLLHPPQQVPLPPHVDRTPPPSVLMPPVGFPIARPQLGSLPYRIGPADEPLTSTSPTERSSKAIALMIGATILGIAAGLFFTLYNRDDQRGNAPAASAGSDEKLVLDPNALPEGPTKKMAVEAPVAPPPVTPPPPTVAPPPVITTETPVAPPPIRTPRIKPKPDKVVAPPPPKDPKVAKVTKIDDEPVEVGSGDPAALFQDAATAHMGGDLKAAEVGYKKALQANRGYAPAWRGLGILYQGKGNKPKAIEALKTYLRLAPNAKDTGSVRARIESLGGS